jgi:predicted DNA-binding protein
VGPCASRPSSRACDGLTRIHLSRLAASRQRGLAGAVGANEADAIAEAIDASIESITSVPLAANAGQPEDVHDRGDPAMAARAAARRVAAACRSSRACRAAR